jgi:hypothetical protein
MSEPYTERAAFEAWILHTHGKCALDDEFTGAAWDAWQARAAAVAPTGETITELAWRDEDVKAVRCSCCGGAPSLWEVDREGTITKMVNCDTAEIAEGAGIMESCPLYSPGLNFNKATRKAAILYWNQFNERLVALRGAEAVHGMRGVVLFNPYTGTPRHPFDITSDPHGRAIVEPGEPLHAAEGR